MSDYKTIKHYADEYVEYELYYDDDAEDGEPFTLNYRFLVPDTSEYFVETFKTKREALKFIKEHLTFEKVMP